MNAPDSQNLQVATESARSEDREAAPRTDVDALAVDLGQTHDHEIGLHDRFEAVFRGQAEALIARGWTARGDLSTAWSGAEAALPEGWELTVALSKYRGGWVAYANEYALGRAPGAPYIPLVESEPFPESSPTPAAALTALTARLQARSTEQGGAG